MACLKCGGSLPEGRTKWCGEGCYRAGSAAIHYRRHRVLKGGRGRGDVKAQKARQVQRRLAYNRGVLAEWKRGGCVVCGETTPVAIDAHHLCEGRTKRNVWDSAGHWVRASKSRLANGLKGCVPLCSNCHRKYHAGLISLDVPVCDSQVESFFL